MADATTTQEKYVFSPNTITAADYQTIKAEREEMVKKQQQAGNEFMFQHYARLLRQMDLSYDKATRANIRLETRTRREEAKKKRDTFKRKR
jgi:hypothetical protein